MLYINLSWSEIKFNRGKVYVLDFILSYRRKIVPLGRLCVSPAPDQEQDKILYRRISQQPAWR